jgi:hypothetical protein
MGFSAILTTGVLFSFSARLTRCPAQPVGAIWGGASDGRESLRHPATTRHPVQGKFYTVSGNRYNYLLWGGTERLNNSGCFRGIPHDSCPFTYSHLLASDFNLTTISISVACPRPVQTATGPQCIPTLGAFRDVVCKHR